MKLHTGLDQSKLHVISEFYAKLNLTFANVQECLRHIISAKKEKKMANCCDMKEGDIFVCDICGLELSVKKPCTCDSESPDKCTVPLQCCNQDMKKK